MRILHLSPTRFRTSRTAMTAVLGAILLTAYLGGAVATHVRVAEAFAIPVVLGVLAWAGLFLRDARVRDLLPLRKAAPRNEAIAAA